MIEELGRGAFGAVYRAREPSAGREVAIKLLLDPHRKPHRLERFRREAHALARLEHPGVVRVHRADLEGGMPCLVMEFVRGRRLDQVIDEDPPLDERLELLEQIAQAVAAAHAAGVVHRDLKPANVLVTADGCVKVTDFGLARDLDRETRLTETGTMLGTPSYMAPEQVRGGDVGPATDVWALGVLAYWLLTDERPFVGETVVELCHQIVNVEPVRPSRVSRRLTPKHDRLVAAALQKDATRRPSAAELAELAAEVRADPGPRAPWLPFALVAAGAALLAVAGGAVIAGRGGEPAAAASASPSATPTAPPSATPSGSPSTSLPPPREPRRTGPHAALWKEYDAAEARDEPDAMIAAASEVLQRAPSSIAARVAVAWGHDLTVHRRTKVTRGLTALLKQVASQELSELSEEDREAVAWANVILAQYAFVVDPGVVKPGESRDAAVLRYLSAAIRHAPKHPTARTRRGKLLLFTGKKNDAASGCRDDLERAVLHAPHDAEALRNLATLRWDDAKEDYVADARRHELWAEAEALYARALRADPDDAEAYQLRAWLWRDRASFAAKKKDLEAARAYEAKRDADYDAALKQFRRGADAAGPFYRRARAFRRAADRAATREEGARRLGDALWGFSRATALNRRHPLANAHAGRLGVEFVISMLLRGASGSHKAVQRRVRRAYSDLSWARSVNRRSWEAASWYAECLMLVNKPKLALAEAEAGLLLAPERDRAPALRAKAAALIASRRYADALIALQVVLVTRPGDPVAWWLQSQALSGSGRRAEAQQALQRARAALRW